MDDFSKPLMEWFSSNARDLPWKNDRDPYSIWLSEIILQQTRVAQGLPYFLKFKAAFPTVYALATAPLEQVLLCWQGLGYYSRARNMHKAANMVVDQFGGHFPQDLPSLLSLPGVGRYTANAIMSYAFDKQNIVVDGNVIRIVSRYLGIADSKITQDYTQMEAKVTSLMGHTNAASFNQAMMDFGSAVCTPKNPMCGQCPVGEHCWAASHGTQNDLPPKKISLKKVHRYFHYFNFQDTENTTIIRQRRQKDIWQGLFEWPLIETNDGTLVDDSQIFEVAQQISDGKIKPNHIFFVDAIRSKAILSHQVIHIHLYHIKFLDVLDKIELKENLVKTKNVGNFAMPKALIKALATSTPNTMHFN